MGIVNWFGCVTGITKEMRGVCVWVVRGADGGPFVHDIPFNYAQNCPSNKLISSKKRRACVLSEYGSKHLVCVTV